MGGAVGLCGLPKDGQVVGLFRPFVHLTEFTPFSPLSGLPLENKYVVDDG